MNEYSARLDRIRKELRLNVDMLYINYGNSNEPQMSIKQFRKYFSGDQIPPRHLISWFCRNAEISESRIYGPSPSENKPTNLDELLSDLTEEQLSVIKSTIAAFRKANAANAKEA